MNTPLTDEFITTIKREQLESERLGVAQECIFERLAQFARNLESKLNGSNVTDIVKVGSKLEHRSGTSGTVSFLDEKRMLIRVTHDTFGTTKEFTFKEFMDQLEFEKRTMGLVIEY